MMNFEEVKATFEDMKEFEFKGFKPREAARIVGCSQTSFKGPGFYLIEVGSRRMLEAVTFLGETEDCILVPTMEECVAEMSEGFEDDCFQMNEYVEEFYYVEEDFEQRGVLCYGYTEEEYVQIIKVV